MIEREFDTEKEREKRERRRKKEKRRKCGSKIHRCMNYWPHMLLTSCALGGKRNKKYVYIR